MQLRKDSMLLECARHKEWEHVSMDGLLRPTRRLVGQEDYRASKAKRALSVVPDDQARISKYKNCFFFSY